MLELREGHLRCYNMRRPQMGSAVIDSEPEQKQEKKYRDWSNNWGGCSQIIHRSCHVSAWVNCVRVAWMGACDWIIDPFGGCESHPWSCSADTASESMHNAVPPPNPATALSQPRCWNLCCGAAGALLGGWGTIWTPCFQFQPGLSKGIASASTYKIQ